MHRPSSLFVFLYTCKLLCIDGFEGMDMPFICSDEGTLISSGALQFVIERSLGVVRNKVDFGLHG